MGALDVDTAVRGSGGHYEVTPKEDWRIWGPMGRYAAWLALRAAAAEVDPNLDRVAVVSVLLAAAFESVDLIVEVRRSSRRTAATAVSMVQGGSPVLDAQIWFAAGSDLVRHDHAGSHPHGDPFDHPAVAELTDEEPPFPFWTNLDHRVVSWVEDWASYPGASRAGRNGCASCRPRRSPIRWSRRAGC